jgi:hypothetical protein
MENIRVEVYYNLHRKCLSVRSRVTGPTYGKVIGHLPAIVLHNVTFHVSEPGRQRVLREKRKNVHAVVRGEVNLEWLRRVFAQEQACDPYIVTPKAPPALADRIVPVTYNPYMYETFVTRHSERPVVAAEMVEIKGRSMTACNPVYHDLQRPVKTQENQCLTAG